MGGVEVSWMGLIGGGRGFGGYGFYGREIPDGELAMMEWAFCMLLLQLAWIEASAGG